MNYQNQIRNFCIISHIDHGKSTLADRFLELTGTIEKRKMREQFLDQMDLEREKGITIKLQPVRMKYELRSMNYEEKKESKTSLLQTSEFILNLIDTPGHLDFSYEVSRSLAAVEGAILLVDATKGVQAQTLANLHLASGQRLVIIPVINKIDLAGARVEEVEKEIREILKSEIPTSQILKISAKKGIGIEELLQEVIEKIPSAKGQINRPLKALIFDSNYDPYKGVIAYVRIFDGQVKQNDKIILFDSEAKSEVKEVGIFRPDLRAKEILVAGEIGYIATGIKDITKCRVGDTITTLRLRSGQELKISEIEPLAGYQEPKPMVFASFYPAKEKDFDSLEEGLNKLGLNDASLGFEPESSPLGRGFKCGFLGMLHLEIISERLKREFNLSLVITSPGLAYQLIEKSTSKPRINPEGILRGKEKIIYSAWQMPEPHLIKSIKELWVKLEIITPAYYLGQVMKLLERLEGIYKNSKYLTDKRLIIEYEVPLREIIVDFYDRLKSTTAGYASMNYQMLDWREADLVRLDILVAREKISAFSKIVPKKRAQKEGQLMVKRLKEVIPPQLFALSLQATIGSKIIARETISALRKDVTGYLYGGDYTRKRKLLEKQKRGKKKMKALAKVNIPPEVFLAVLKR